MIRPDAQLRARLFAAEKDERHINHAETMYWINQYRLLAKDAVALASSQSADIERARDAILHIKRIPLKGNAVVVLGEAQDRADAALAALSLDKPFESHQQEANSSVPQDATETADKAMVVLSEIHEERQRQMKHEGYTPEGDDLHYRGHHAGEMALGAAAYCMSAACDASPLATTKQRLSSYAAAWWPWHENGRIKPKGARRDLIRAAALIVAEVERLDRQGSNGDVQRGRG